MGGAWALWVALASVSVSGRGDCPTKGAVQSELEKLSWPRQHHAPKARVDSDAARMLLSLDPGDGGKPQEKEVVSAADCASRARAAAVILAAWLSSLEAPPAAAPAPPVPAELTPTADEVRSPEPAVLPARSNSFQLELGGGLSLGVARMVLPGGVLFVSAGGKKHGFGGTFLMSLHGGTEVTLPSGAFYPYESFAVALGPKKRFNLGQGSLDVDVLGRVSMVSFHSYATSGESHELFACAGPMVSLRLRSSVGLWGGLAGTSHLGCTAAPGLESEVKDNLARFEMFFSLGASWEMN